MNNSMSNNTIEAILATVAVNDSATKKETALLQLEAARVYLQSYINTKFDGLKARVESGEPIDCGSSAVATEEVYPLCFNSAIFKGKKPTAIHFGEELVKVRTWRAVHTLILQRCAAIPQNHTMLLRLRNIVSGRDRVFLSDKPDGMNVPVKIAGGIYAEAYMDTEWLMRVLTNDILDMVGYDYSGIAISTIPNKRCEKYGRRYR